MKKYICFLLLIAPLLVRSESFEITFNTSTYDGFYKPTNCLAVWVTTESGTFVKTLGRWCGDSRNEVAIPGQSSRLNKRYDWTLVEWWEVSGKNGDYDGIMGATRTTHNDGLIVTWDFTNKADQSVANGNYVIHLEMSEDNDYPTAPANPNGSNIKNFTFVRDGTSQTVAVGTLGIFSNINYVYDCNNAPVAQDQSVTTNEDTAKAITLTATDTDGDGLTYSIVTQPAHGNVSGTPPNVTYTPDADWFGTDTFTFKANDGSVDSNVATVTVTVSSVNDPPVAQNKSVATDEDTAKVITLVATDADGDGLTYEIISQPSNGSLSGTEPNVTYMPNAGWSGTDTFTFKANDGSVDSNVATVTVTVSSVNDPPVAQNKSVATDEDTAKVITLVATDSDGDSLTYAIVSQPSNGSLSGTEPNVTYMPNADWFGTDTFTFKANDGTTDSGLATVTVTVNSVNDAPVAQNHSTSTAQGVAKSITLTATDDDGDSLTYSIISQPSNGSLSGTPPDMTYTPTAGWSGTDTFTFKANDGTVDSNVATVTVTVSLNPNIAPVAQGQSLATDEDVAKVITLTATDADSDPLTYAVVSQPSNGNLSGTPPNVTYTPNTGWSGADTFTFKANDGTDDSNSATISIAVASVNDVPVAQDQSLSASAGTAKAIVLVAVDDDGDSLTYAIVSQPSNGGLSGTPPNVTYTSTAGWSGTDTFTFKANDGSVDSNVATVTVTVTAGNSAPVVVDQSLITPKGTAKDVTLTASDANGDSLTYTVVTQPSNGSLSGTVPNLTYTPNAGWSGTDTFTFKANDGSADSNSATVSIRVNSPPVADEQSVSTDKNAAKAIVLTATDGDDITLTFIIVSQPLNGTLTGTAPNLTYTPTADWAGTDSFTFKANDGYDDSNEATVTIIVDEINEMPTADDRSAVTLEDMSISVYLTGDDVNVNDVLTFSVVDQPIYGTLTGTAPDLVYTPNTNWNGTDTFTFVVNDGFQDSGLATVSVDVVPVDDPVELSTVTATSPVTLPATATLDATIVDVDGDLLTVSWSVAAGPASVVITQDDSSSAAATAAFPQAGVYMLEVTVYDAYGSDTDSVIVNVFDGTGLNTPPVALDLEVDDVVNQPVSITLTGYDLEEDSLTYATDSQPSNGSLTGSAPNLTYTPAVDWTGTDSFTFVVNDGSLDSAAATVTVTVKEPNVAPVAGIQGVVTTIDQDVAVYLLALDDNDDDLTFVLTTLPQHGTLSGNPPTLTYTPVAGWIGMDFFSFKVNDGTVDSEEVTVTVTVTGDSDQTVQTGAANDASGGCRLGSQSQSASFLFVVLVLAVVLGHRRTISLRRGAERIIHPATGSRRK